MNRNILDELSAVKQFLKNRGDQFQWEEIKKLENNSPIDIIFKKTNEKFQIKLLTPDEIEVVNKLDVMDAVKKGNFEGRWIGVGAGKTKTFSGGGDIMGIFIREPIEYLISKYGKNNKSLNNIICILFVKETLLPFKSVGGWIKRDIEVFQEIKETGFKEIYLVDHKNNIKIYPLN